MAKVINNDTQSQSISASYSLWRIALVGIALGAIYGGLSPLIQRYINSTEVSGGIATILVATLGIIVMLRLHMAQPLIVGITTGVTLWGLAQWTSGLNSVEAVAWSVLLYGLAYILFSWVARYARALPVLITVIIIIVAVRIASAL
ncbi:MAG TPA: hypothetical protein VMR16_00020 [Candidatus Saccharimonadales bacterium]|nr:hypothetical protein [Candidatus Saccharimonadales bacterium]